MAKGEQAAEQTRTAVGRTAGSGGFKILAAATYTDVAFESIIILDTATTLTGYEESDAGGVATDMLAARGLSGVAVPPGTYLPAPQGKLITKLINNNPVIAYYKSY